MSKLFTSVLFGQLVEQGLCSYEDKISRYLEADLLKNLHVYKEKDYTNEIKIKHLVNNTSGLHDFVEDKPLKGKSMPDLLVDEPNRTWAPLEVIQWAKENMKSHFPPGGGFHYSDTGYTDITNSKSLSILYAGGGVVSTTGDLLKFMKDESPSTLSDFKEKNH